MTALVYLGIALAVVKLGIWVANLAMAKLLSAGEPKPSLSDEWR